MHNNDALRAIQSVNNITIDGRSIKTSLGTTKYCSHFMKNQVCPKPDCMYLHELGDPEASFTKEEMHQGKHQEYEKRLHDSLIAQMQQQSQQSATGSSNPATSSPISITGNSASSNGILNNIEESKDNVSSGCNNNGAANNNDQIQKEVWPSLSTSPVTIKENKGNVKGRMLRILLLILLICKNVLLLDQKEMSKNEVNSTRKHEKVKGEKSKDNNKHHQKTSSSFSSTSTNGNGSSSKENRLQSNNHNIEDDSNETDSDDSPSISSNSTDSCNVSESDSVKSSPPSSFPDPIVLHHRSNNNKKSTNYNSLTLEKISVKNEQQQQQNSIINANDITKPLYSPSNDKIIKDSENLPDMSG